MGGPVARSATGQHNARPLKNITDEQFVGMLARATMNELANQLGVAVGTIRWRKQVIEKKTGKPVICGLPPKSRHYHAAQTLNRHPGRLEYTMRNGVALIGSDFHIWPGDVPTMHRAFLKFCRKMEPGIVILNGDVVDMAAVSRHPPIGWETQPTVQQEIETAQARLHDIEIVCGKIPKVWTLGNHDARFETRIATVAPEYAKLHGVHLRDHFPNWEPCWSCWINDDVVVKHRFKGGIHAPWNNTINSGKTIVTGHLHSAKVTPFTDYNGTRYGVDTGCMADPGDRAFLDYTEDNPKNWRAAFGVFTFVDGMLLFPELVIKVDETHVQFRGELIEV